MTVTGKIEKTPGLYDSWVLFFFAVTVLSSLACTNHTKGNRGAFPTNSPNLFYINNVPFFPEDEDRCGSSVLASVFNYFGYNVSPDDISKSIYSESLNGTLNIDMINYVKQFTEGKGLTFSEESGDIELIKKEVRDGHPVVVFADLGIWSIRKGHYMLIVGYDDSREGIIAYSGLKRDKFISYDRFMRIWERGGYWTLRVISD